MPCRSRSPRRFRPFLDHHENEHDGESDNESDSLSVPLNQPPSPVSLFSYESNIDSTQAVSGERDYRDTAWWMAPEVVCHIQLANLGGHVKELCKYQFVKGQDVTMDLLALRIKDALSIERMEKFQYCVGKAEIKFTKAMCLRLLQDWMYEMDPWPSSGGGSVLTVTIQCVGDWATVHKIDDLMGPWRSAWNVFRGDQKSCSSVLFGALRRALLCSAMFCGALRCTAVLCGALYRSGDICALRHASWL